MGLVAGLLICLAGPLGARGPAVSTEPETLPSARQLAAALSEPELRIETLLNLVAVDRLLGYGSMAHPRDVEALIRRFEEDRDWLDHLADHYVEIPLRGPQLDPAAWWVALELGQYQVRAGTLAGPEGPDDEGLKKRVFDRAHEKLAAQTLPELLQRVEGRAVSLWQAAQGTAETNPALLHVLLRVSADHFGAWRDVPIPASLEAAAQGGPLPAASEAVAALAADALLVGPPDRTRLRRLRFDLFAAMPQLEGEAAAEAARLLALASALDGLNENRYLELTETLLWVVSDLLLSADSMSAAEDSPPATDVPRPEAGETTAAEPVQPQSAKPVAESTVQPVVPRLLYDLLPRLSRSFAAEFSRLDRRIDNTLANLYETVQYLQANQPDSMRLTALRTRMADSVAQYALLLPEMSFYYDQPVRWPISEEIDVCLVRATNRAGEERGRMTAAQFDSCMDRLVTIATQWVSREDLAGDRDGPFGSEHLQRELMLPAWQRINYALAYLHEHYETNCSLPEEPLPNPVEWAGIANLIVWFVSQAPDLGRTPANRERIQHLQQLGTDLNRVLSQQVDCISGSGTGISDPVIRGLADYRAALDELVGTLREAEIEFRMARLETGADVVLGGDAHQQTAYRKEGLTIGPCDPSQVCEMTGELDAGANLIGRFPTPYLVSDQTRMGEIEICYENVQWIERRSEAVRADDPYVANYYGRLSFDIIGRHHENDETTKVFGYTFRTPEEYHYLFAQASDEVAADDCPTEWIGSRIVAPLGNTGGLRVVPDRLTYLAGARSKPSEIITANWSRGEKWRDWLISGPAVTPHGQPEDAGIADRVNRHLQALYRAKQAQLYSALLLPARNGGRSAPDDLFDLQQELSARKALIRSYLILFYPTTLTSEAEIRSALEGSDALLDTEVLRRFHEENVAVSSINERGRWRLQQFQTHWDRQPDTMRRSGSIARSVSHALLRLQEIEERYLREKPAMTPRGLRG